MDATREMDATHSLRVTEIEASWSPCKKHRRREAQSKKMARRRQAMTREIMCEREKENNNFVFRF